jgi:hypothetical protein
MSQTELDRTAKLSPTHDYFLMMFEGADVYTALWQPLLKSVGRWHLEVAGLGVKQGQAALQLSRDLSRSWTPADAYAANIRFWETTSSLCAMSSQRLAATVVQAVDAPVMSDVVPLPVKRGHDTMVLPGSETSGDLAPARKVA